jgi:glutathione S-transferase
MKLYDCTVAPSPRRVRIFAAEKGLDLQKVEVDLIGGENLKPEFLGINPRGVVPALELDDGTRIDEVVAICRYLEALHPAPPLMGTDPLTRAVIESRTRHMELDGFLSVANVFRNSSPGFAKRGLPGIVEEVPAIPALVDRGTAGIGRFFRMLEDYLSKTTYVAGNDYSIADITALTVVDFAGWVEQPIPSANTNTRRWYESVASRPSAKA